jgi:hypothetical protein
VKAFSLAKADWDFKTYSSSSSQKEINVCYHYEFAREVPSICEGIEKFRSFPRRLFGADLMRGLFGDDYNLDAFLGDQPLLVAPEHPEFFLNYPEWPRNPYFAIDPAVRERRLRALIPDETNDEDLAKRLQLPFGIENPNIWPEVKLSIPIYCTHEQLIEAFDAYLRLHFPLQGKAGKKSDRKVKFGNAQGGAAEVRTQRNALRALGVYRLRKRMKAKQVLELFEETYQGRQPYSDESALNRAKALATKYLARFEELRVSDWLESQSTVPLEP